MRSRRFLSVFDRTLSIYILIDRFIYLFIHSKHTGMISVTELQSDGTMQRYKWFLIRDRLLSVLHRF